MQTQESLRNIMQMYALHEKWHSADLIIKLNFIHHCIRWGGGSLTQNHEFVMFSFDANYMID